MEAYWYWLCCTLFMDRPWARRLLEEYGNPKAIFEAEEGELRKKYPEKAARHRDILQKRREWEPEERLAAWTDTGAAFCSSAHPQFPSALGKIPDPPLGLFVRGRLPAEDCPGLAIVGTRMCSAYGRMTAGLFGRELAEQGVQIISGMALGVDGYAHRGALEAGGSTFAVLGCGADICYPRKNRDLYEEIQEKGGILSEYPPGTPPMPRLFPPRNRIISGLSHAVLVVEAREKSGSLITADAALEQGRDVFAVPGRLGDVLSSGCNRLLTQGAGAAISTDFLLQEMHILKKTQWEKEGNNKNVLESSEFLVYSCLSLQSKHIDEIQKETGLSLIQVMRLLVSLELKGLVCEVQKNYYSKADSKNGMEKKAWQNI